MKRHAIRLFALALAVTVISASSMGAQDYCSSPGTCYTPPAAHVAVGSGPEIAVDFDGLIDGDLETLIPRMAIAGLAGASGYAESTRNHFAVKAFTNGAQNVLGGNRSAHAFAHFIFIPHDSQHRPDVTVDLKLRMSASASGAGGGSYGVVVCGIGERGRLGTNASGQLNYVEPPRCGSLVPYSYVAGTGGGIWWRILSKFRQTYYNLTGNGTYVEDDLDTGIHVIPELPYLITVFAGSSTNLAYGGAGLAAVDPVIEAAAVNPDVTIEFPNLADNPNPQPLLGELTPAALEAMGLDAQPFVDLGFFDPPSQDPPPSEPPSPSPSKPWCGPGFWLTNVTKFGAGAWPVNKDDDYNSTAGQRAGCPVATGNPTLLQVLQNPNAYFSRQLQGVGFNCVADHLSGKSGLLGTAADNNAPCSIDQFGQQIP